MRIKFTRNANGTISLHNINPQMLSYILSASSNCCYDSMKRYAKENNAENELWCKNTLDFLRDLRIIFDSDLEEKPKVTPILTKKERWNNVLQEKRERLLIESLLEINI